MKSSQQLQTLLTSPNNTFIIAHKLLIQSFFETRFLWQTLVAAEENFLLLGHVNGSSSNQQKITNKVKVNN